MIKNLSTEFRNKYEKEIKKYEGYMEETLADVNPQHGMVVEVIMRMHEQTYSFAKIEVLLENEKYVQKAWDHAAIVELVEENLVEIDQVIEHGNEMEAMAQALGIEVD